MKIIAHPPDSPLRERFNAFASDLYVGDLCYRPHVLEPVPHYPTHCFLAMENDMVTGRAATITNPVLRYNGETAGLVGFFECRNDQLTAQALLEACATHLRVQGCAWCLGPCNGDTWHSYRTAEPDSFPPFFLDIHHKPWYGAQFFHSGFQPVAQYISTIASCNTIPDSCRRNHFTARLARRNISERPLDTSRFRDELMRLFTVSTTAFTNNFLYTPIACDEFLALYEPLQKIIDPDFVRLAVDANDEPLAFIFAVADPGRTPPDTLVVKTVATMPVPQARGLGAWLVERIHSRAQARGFRNVIHALMHTSNQSTAILHESARIFRRYSLWGMRLDQIAIPR